MKKRIGVVVAIEIEPVLAKYGEPKEKRICAGMDIMTYTGEAFTMYVIHSGAGEISAAIATQILISEYKVDMILNFGVVGALTESIATTELCVVEKAVHYDFDAKDWLGLKIGQYPDEEDIFFYTDRHLSERALEIAPELKKTACASADKFVAEPEAKAMLHEKYGADICEMEAAGIIITCKKNNVPCLLIKAVSDCLTGSNTEFFNELDRVSRICFDVADKVINSL